MEIQGVNSKVELALVSKVLRERKNTALMEEGVILIDPANTYIEDEVKIGRDTTIYPNVTYKETQKSVKTVKYYQVLEL